LTERPLIGDPGGRQPVFSLASGDEQRMHNVAHDTIACPAPESGEHAVVHIEVDSNVRRFAPNYVESITGELRGLIAGLRCPQHGAAPAVHLALGPDDDTSVAVVPHDCCPMLDDLVADALKGSSIFRLMRPA
jgi:hypothetical protein